MRSSRPTREIPIPYEMIAATRRPGPRPADPRPSEIDRHEVEAIRRGLDQTQELQTVA
jgi:hypothetical protein